MAAQQNDSALTPGAVIRLMENHLLEKYGVVPMHRISGTLSSAQIGGEHSDGDVPTADSTVEGRGVVWGAANDHSHDKADLPASVAYEDEANTFTATQTFAFPSFCVYIEPTEGTINLRLESDAHPRLRLIADGSVNAGDGTIAPTTAGFRTLNSIQTQDALLDAIAALGITDNRIIVGTGTDTVELWTVTDFAKTLLDDADAATARATLGAKANLASSARVRHSANQAITTGTTTVLAFDTEDYDTQTLHDTATNNSRLTAPVAGIYDIGALVQWQANTTGRRMAVLRVNGTDNIAVNRVTPVQEAGVTTDQNVQTHYALAANDYVEVTVRQDSGGNLDARTGAPNSPVFYMTYLGASS